MYAVTATLLRRQPDYSVHGCVVPFTQRKNTANDMHVNTKVFVPQWKRNRSTETPPYSTPRWFFFCNKFYSVFSKVPASRFGSKVGNLPNEAPIYRTVSKKRVSILLRSNLRTPKAWISCIIPWISSWSSTLLELSARLVDTKKQ